MIEVIREAIENKHQIKFTYKGEERVVEPHLLGINKHRQLALRAWQVSGDKPEWKLFYIERAENVTETGLSFVETRPLYNPEDKDMDYIWVSC